MIIRTEVVQHRILNGILQVMGYILWNPRLLCAPAEVKKVIHGIQIIVLSVMGLVGVIIERFGILHKLSGLMHESVECFRDRVSLRKID